MTFGHMDLRNILPAGIADFVIVVLAFRQQDRAEDNDIDGANRRENHARAQLSEELERFTAHSGVNIIDK